MNFIMGFIFGVVVCTVGVQGIARIADSGVHKLQDTVRQVSQEVDK
jgi:hypothetical protein